MQSESNLTSKSHYKTTRTVEDTMPPIKPLDAISAKWARVASVSEQSYTEGVTFPRADWLTNTSAANDNYKAGLNQSLSQDRFLKGVKAATTKKWQDNAIAKGPGRWSQGIALSLDNYSKGFAPYRAAISSLVLPPRGPKGDPKNIARVAAVAKTLNDLKRAAQSR